jgi:hypothetical protein
LPRLRRAANLPGVVDVGGTLRAVRVAAGRAGASFSRTGLVSSVAASRSAASCSGLLVHMGMRRVVGALGREPRVNGRNHPFCSHPRERRY